MRMLGAFIGWVLVMCFYLVLMGIVLKLMYHVFMVGWSAF